DSPISVATKGRFQVVRKPECETATGLAESSSKATQTSSRSKGSSFSSEGLSFSTSRGIESCAPKTYWGVSGRRYQKRRFSLLSTKRASMPSLAVPISWQNSASDAAIFEKDCICSLDAGRDCCCGRTFRVAGGLLLKLLRELSISLVCTGEPYLF